MADVAAAKIAAGSSELVASQMAEGATSEAFGHAKMAMLETPESPGAQRASLKSRIHDFLLGREDASLPEVMPGATSLAAMVLRANHEFSQHVPMESLSD